MTKITQQIKQKQQKASTIHTQPRIPKNPIPCTIAFLSPLPVGPENTASLFIPFNIQWF